METMIAHFFTSSIDNNNVMLGMYCFSYKRRLVQYTDNMYTVCVGRSCYDANAAFCMSLHSILFFRLFCFASTLRDSMAKWFLYTIVMWVREMSVNVKSIVFLTTGATFFIDCFWDRIIFATILFIAVIRILLHGNGHFVFIWKLNFIS